MLTNNLLPHLLGFILILLLCIPTFFLDKISARFAAHKSLSPSDVSQVILRIGTTERTLEGDEASRLVELYNRIVFISKRSTQSEATEPGTLLLRTKSGEQIRVVRSGTDLDVERTRTGKPAVIYWGRQDELKSLLGGEVEREKA